MSEYKYRPYFTLTELRYLLSLCERDSQVSPMTIFIRDFIDDCEKKKRKAQLKTNPRPSMDERLGFSEPIKETVHRTNWEKEQQKRFEDGLMTPQEENDWIDYCNRKGI